MSVNNLTPQKRLNIYNNSNGKCIYCDCDIKWENFTIDHVKAKSKKGPSGVNNYACCCSDCNSVKGNMSVEEFDNFINNLHVMLRTNQYFRVMVKHFKINLKRKTSFVDKCNKLYSDIG